jgi:hypothetical protein
VTSSETRLHSREGTVGFEMVGDLFVNLAFEYFRKAGQDFMMNCRCYFMLLRLGGLTPVLPAFVFFTGLSGVIRV